MNTLQTLKDTITLLDADHVTAAVVRLRTLIAEMEAQEPVAEIVADDMGRPFNAIQIRTHFFKEVPPAGTKLYAQPVDQPSCDTPHYCQSVQRCTRADERHAQPVEQPKAVVFGGHDVRARMLADAVQQKAEPLSDDEMWSLWNSHGIDEMNQQQAIAFARAAIAATHGIQGGAA